MNMLKKIFQFSWPKLIYSILLTVILFLVSQMTHIYCGIAVSCPQTMSNTFLVLTIISCIYVLIIIIQKLISVLK